MNKVELVVENNWVKNKSYKALLETHPLEIALGLIYEFIDLTYNGNKLTLLTEPEPIFFLIRNFLITLKEIGVGSSFKSVIRLFESPLEFVLYNCNNNIKLSLYHSGLNPSVYLHNVDIDIKNFTNNILTIAHSLITNLKESLKKKKSCILLDEVENLINELREITEKKKIEVSYVTDEEKLVYIVNSSSSKFNINGKVIFTGEDIFSPPIKGGSDLHSLLFKGRLTLQFKDKEVKLPETYLWIFCETLVRGLRPVMEALEEGKPLHKRSIAQDLTIDFHLFKDRKLMMSIGEIGNLEPIVSTPEMEPQEFLQPLFNFLYLLLEKIEENSKEQSLNLRIKNLRSELDTLKEWFVDINQPSLINEDTKIYRVTLNQSLNQEEIQKIAISPRLKYVETWVYELSELELTNILLFNETIIIKNPTKIVALERFTGMELWIEEYIEDGSIIYGNQNCFLHLTPGGFATCYEAKTGFTLWTMQLIPRLGGTPYGIVAGGFKGPKAFVVIEEEKTITALDLTTGQQRWSFKSTRGGNFKFEKAGRLLIFTCGDSSLYAIDGDRGNLIWRFSINHRINEKPYISGNVAIIYIYKEAYKKTTFYGVDIPSGRLLWEKNVEITTPLQITTSKDSLFVVGNTKKGTVLMVFSSSTGDILLNYDLEETDILPLSGMLAWEELIFLHGSGRVVAIDLKRKDIRWHKELGGIIWNGVLSSIYKRESITLRGGALFIADDKIYLVNPSTGKTIYSFEEESLLPEFFAIDKFLNVYIAESGGILGFYTMRRGIKVVK